MVASASSTFRCDPSTYIWLRDRRCEFGAFDSSTSLNKLCNVGSRPHAIMNLIGAVPPVGTRARRAASSVARSAPVCPPVITRELGFSPMGSLQRLCASVHRNTLADSPLLQLILLIADDSFVNSNRNVLFIFTFVVAKIKKLIGTEKKRASVRGSRHNRIESRQPT